MDRLFSRTSAVLDRDGINSAIFSRYRGVYLVGGCIRDALIGRETKDRDYAVDIEPRHIAEFITKRYGGSVIQFRDRRTVRAVLCSGDTLDFSLIDKEISYDLVGRDFSMNAIAYRTGHGFIDPCNGIGAIREKTIRASGPKSLVTDPLRCLRAYRFVSELGWRLDERTREIARRGTGRIDRVAPERITGELVSLVNGPFVNKALHMALRDRIINKIICINNNRIKEKSREILKVNAYMKKLPARIKRILDRVVTIGLTGRGMVFLEILLSGAAIDRSRIILSKEAIRRVNNASFALQGIRKGIDLYRVLKSCKDMLEDIACLSTSRKVLDAIIKFEKHQKDKIIDGRDIMEITGYRGPIVGEILEEIGREAFYGRVKSRRQVVEFIQKHHKVR